MMKVLKKKVVMFMAIMVLCSAPSWAGSFSAFGSYWDSRDADASWGAGVRLGVDLTKRLELEFHGTWYPAFQNDEFSGANFDITAIPVDAGLKFNFMPDGKVNPFVGAGVSYYFLTIDPGEVDDQVGVYLNGGLDFGSVEGARFFTEVIWRKVDTSVKFGAFDEDVSFDGIGINLGVTWRWGT